MTTSIILETEQLSFRRLALDDLDNIFALYYSPDVRKYYSEGIPTYEETRHELEWIVNECYPKYGFGMCATIYKKTGKFIGRCAAGSDRMTHRVLVTGAAGYLGSNLLGSLAERAGRDGDPACIVAGDVREVPGDRRLPGVAYETLDVRTPGLAAVLARHSIDTVVHLAAIVTPGPKSNRELEYSVAVLGTRNVLEACVAAGVRGVIVTSSGAAYGYHADNPAWLTEDHPVRGNEAFAYSHHKRLVEEMLAEYRQSHPTLEQVVFRVGTILGETTRNQITALFERPVERQLAQVIDEASWLAHDRVIRRTRPPCLNRPRSAPHPGRSPRTPPSRLHRR